MKTNSITIVGNVGTDPTKKELKNDKQVIKFSVAHHKRDESVQWFNVDCWDSELGQQLLQSVDKGARIKVIGSLRVNRYEKKDGSGPDIRLVISLEDFELIAYESVPEEEVQAQKPAK
jgi:single-strand DNA-binding protein